jgi:hypothetical protein
MNAAAALHGAFSARSIKLSPKIGAIQEIGAAKQTRRTPC